MNTAASRAIQPNASNPQGGAQTGKPLQTDEILRSIREKLGLASDGNTSLNNGSASPSVSATQKNATQAQQSSVSEFSRPNQKSALDLNDHLNDDFSMDMDFGSTQNRGKTGDQTFTTQPSAKNGKDIEAAYKAYNGAKRYDNVMNAQASEKNDIGSFHDFADNSSTDAHGLDSHAEGFQSEWEDDDSDDIAPQKQANQRMDNVSKFQPARPANTFTSSRTSAHAVSDVSKKAPALYGERMNATSLVSRMLQKELASYIQSWAGRNERDLMQYVQQACDSWCAQNVQSVLQECVEEWCDANLESLCADIIRDELNREYKTA